MKTPVAKSPEIVKKPIVFRERAGKTSILSPVMAAAPKLVFSPQKNNLHMNKTYGELPVNKINNGDRTDSIERLSDLSPVLKKQEFQSSHSLLSDKTIDSPSLFESEKKGKGA